MNTLARLKILGAAFGLAFAVGAYADPIAGTSSGVFQNPVGAPGMVTTGAGTNTFTWGIGVASPPSSLTFLGTGFAGVTGSPFQLGTITYFNGAITNPADSVDLAITLVFSDPFGIAQTLTYMLSLVNTTNTADPIASADIVQFPATLPLETFVVGGIPYTLALDVGTVSGAGFSSQHTFSVLEGASATASLIGTLTMPSAVPEPASVALLSVAMLGLALSRRRRAR